MSAERNPLPPRVVALLDGVKALRDAAVAYDGNDDYDPDPFEEAAGECGLIEDGSYMLAGTEHWDFECPFRG